MLEDEGLDPITIRRGHPAGTESDGEDHQDAGVLTP